MLRIRSYRPKHATLVAYLALFVALGGSSYAAVRIGSSQIVNNSVRSKDIRNGQVTSRDLKDNDVRSRDVRNGSLLSSDFKPGQLPAGAQGPKGHTGPTGPQGKEGLPGKDGRDGVTGHRQVSAPMNDTPLGPGSFRQETASCASGEVAVGGGFYALSTTTADQRHLVVQASTPVQGTSAGWYVAVRNTDQVVHIPRVTVHAICMKAPQ